MARQRIGPETKLLCVSALPWEMRFMHDASSKLIHTNTAFGDTCCAESCSSAKIEGVK